MVLVIVIGGLGFLWVNDMLPRAQPTISSQKGSDTIELYATAWCGYCKKTRQLFKGNNIRYVEYDIEKDSTARQRYQNLKGRGVPLIVANGTVIRGYNESELRKLTADKRYKL